MKSSRYFSAASVICLFSAKVGCYCGEFSEISQPLLPMGTKTPVFVLASSVGDAPAKQQRREPGIHENFEKSGFRFTTNA
jgi:hypothetical protein